MILGLSFPDFGGPSSTEFWCLRLMLQMLFELATGMVMTKLSMDTKTAADSSDPMISLASDRASPAEAEWLSNCYFLQPNKTS